MVESEWLRQAIDAPAAGPDRTPRLIGRDAELGLLQRAFFHMFEHGGAQVVSVMGEAGLGTSRLLDEFSEWLEPRPERFNILRGRSAPDTQAVPRGLLRELVANRFEINDDDTSSEVASKLRSGLSSLTSRQADVAGHWIGFDLADSEAVRDLAGSDDFGTVGFGHLTTHFRWLLAHAPAVVLLEDVHWSDPESLDAIDQLVDALQAAPALVVCGAHPSLLEHRPQWGAGPGAGTTIRLRPLNDHDGRDLVRGILQLADDVPSQLVDLIVEHAKGNPFHAEELVRMFIDHGVIGVDGGTWRVDLDRLDRDAVPSTLQGVIKARLDALGPRELTMLQHASVIGQTFWDDALVALSPAGQSGPASHADVLLSLSTVGFRDFVGPRDRSVFSGCREYAFRHELIREATYETVLQRDRSQLHRATAAWLERRSGERLGEHVELLAKHLTHAGELGRASDLLHEAGARAGGTGALQSAVKLYERSLVIRDEIGAGHSLAATSTRIELAHLLALLGRNDEALSTYDAADSDARRVGNGRLAASALAGALRISAVRGDWHESAGLVERVRPMAERFGGEILGRFLSAEATLLVDGPDRELETAQRLTERALGIWRDLGDPVSELRAINELALVNIRAGRPADADRWITAGLALARRIEDTSGEWMLLQNRAVFAHLAARAGDEDYARVLELYRSSLERRQLLGLPHILSLANLAQAEIEAGHLEDGARHAREALRIAWQRHDPRDWTLSLITVGQLAIAAGDLDEGLRILGAVRAHRSTPSLEQEIEAVLNVHGVDPTRASEGMAAGATTDVVGIVEQILADDA